MSETDRLVPVITLCVYWGSEPWTGPRNLHEMLDIPAGLEQYKSIIGDYPLNILEVCRIENLEAYSGELKALFGFLKFQKNKESLKAFVDNNQEIFRSMTWETAQAISILGDARTLERYLREYQLGGRKSENNREAIDMCQALQEMIRDGEREGGIRTLIEDNLEEQIPLERILEKLQRRFLLTEDEARTYLERYRG